MTAFGIDFGTSTTAIARSGPGTPAFVVDAAGKDVIPSVIAFTPSNRIEVGGPAKARRLIDPVNTLYSLKRVLGLAANTPAAQEFRTRYPFRSEIGDDQTLRFITRAGSFSADQATVKMLATLRESARIAPSDVANTCVTVPVGFNADQRRAIISVVESSGFCNVSVIEEPAAAAYAYVDTFKSTTRAAIYDLGGGTFDFAVVELGSGGVRLGGARVLGSEGNSYLGGDDIDLKLADWAAQEILQRHRVDVRASVIGYATLAQACERLKIRLSELDETVINLASIDPQLEGLSLLIRRSQLEKLSLELVQRTFVTCDAVLARLGIAARSLDTVILAGGSTYIPAVRNAVSHYFGKAPSFDRPSDRIVVLGALKFAEAVAASR